MTPAKDPTRVFAILNSDVQVKPATLMVSKVTVKDPRYTGILMGSVQAGIAHGVLDAVREGLIKKKRVNDLGINIGVARPSVLRCPRGGGSRKMFNVNREATLKVIAGVANGRPSSGSWRTRTRFAHHRRPRREDLIRGRRGPNPFSCEPWFMRILWKHGRVRKCGLRVRAVRVSGEIGRT